MTNIPLIQGNSVQEINTSIIAIKKAQKELETLNTQIDNKIKALNFALSGGPGKYIESIQEVQGLIKVTEGSITDTIASENSQPVTSNGVASAIAYCSSSSTTVTGAPLYTGCVVKVFFTAQINGSNTSTAMTINYNGTNITVKCGKDGSLVNYTAKAVGSSYIYCQANTTFELLYNGTNFIIIGNPVVVSSSDYTIYTDGSITYKKCVRIRESINDANITVNGFFIFSVGNNTSNIPATTFTRTKGYIRHYHSGDGNIVQEFTATGYDKYYNAISEQYIRGSYFDGVNFHFGNWSKL